VDGEAHRGDADDNEMDHHDDIAMTTATHRGGRRPPAAIDSDANDDMMAYVGDRTMAGATSQAKERDDASEGRDRQGGTCLDTAPADGGPAPAEGDHNAPHQFPNAKQRRTWLRDQKRKGRS